MVPKETFGHAYRHLGLSPLGGVFPVSQTVKNLPIVQKTWVPPLGWDHLLEEGMATHPNILAWRIPMDRGARQAKVHGVRKSRMRLRDQAHTAGRGVAAADEWGDLGVPRNTAQCAGHHPQQRAVEPGFASVAVETLKTEGRVTLQSWVSAGGQGGMRSELELWRPR